jgi:hypothetical protein
MALMAEYSLVSEKLTAGSRETGSKEKDDGYQKNCKEGGEESCKEGCSEEGGEEGLQEERIFWIGYRPRPLRLGGIEPL